MPDGTTPFGARSDDADRPQPAGISHGFWNAGDTEATFVCEVTTGFDDVRLPFPPSWVQKAGLAMGAPIGRLLGYEARYDGEAAAGVALAL